VLPALEFDGIGLRQIPGKHGVHLPGKIAAENRRIDFVVVQEAAPVQIGRAMVDQTPSMVAVLECITAPRRS